MKFLRESVDRLPHPRVNITVSDGIKQKSDSDCNRIRNYIDFWLNINL
jgi:hypothetical protein